MPEHPPFPLINKVIINIIAQKLTKLSSPFDLESFDTDYKLIGQYFSRYGKFMIENEWTSSIPSVEVIFFQKRNGKQGKAKNLSKSIYNIYESNNYIAIDPNLRVNKPSPNVNKHAA